MPLANVWWWWENVHTAIAVQLMFQFVRIFTYVWKTFELAYFMVRRTKAKCEHILRFTHRERRMVLMVMIMIAVITFESLKGSQIHIHAKTIARLLNLVLKWHSIWWPHEDKCVCVCIFLWMIQYTHNDYGIFVIIALQSANLVAFGMLIWTRLVLAMQNTILKIHGILVVLLFFSAVSYRCNIALAIDNHT